MARTSGQRSWPLEKSATLQDGFACQGDLILLACPQRQLFTIMERVILDRDGFCEMQVSVTTAANASDGCQASPDWLVGASE